MPRTLYFLDGDGTKHEIARDIAIDYVLTKALADLKTRKPNYISYYQRCWFDNEATLWIDFGSHTEFYIAE